MSDTILVSDTVRQTVANSQRIFKKATQSPHVVLKSCKQLNAESVLLVGEGVSRERYHTFLHYSFSLGIIIIIIDPHELQPDRKHTENQQLIISLHQWK